jgi:hypothetical protein
MRLKFTMIKAVSHKHTFKSCMTVLYVNNFKYGKFNVPIIGICMRRNYAQKLMTELHKSFRPRRWYQRMYHKVLSRTSLIFSAISYVIFICFHTQFVCDFGCLGKPIKRRL